MRQRCLNRRNRSYQGYGGRGIIICEEWQESFPTFFAWAITHGYRPGLTIDRKDNDGPYSPGNCQFIPNKENSRKTRNTKHYITAFGETKTVGQWFEDRRCQVQNKSTLKMRIYSGWTTEKAITTPTEPRCPQMGGIEAFGESKTIAAWLRDPRCRAGKHSTLRMRIVYGWNHEQAIATPPMRARR
jgi:hypothetical protein